MRVANDHPDLVKDHPIQQRLRLFHGLVCSHCRRSRRLWARLTSAEDSRSDHRSQAGDKRLWHWWDYRIERHKMGEKRPFIRLSG